MSFTEFETTPSPFYKGKGEHSVQSLEKLCEEFKELLYQKSIRLQETEAMLKNAQDSANTFQETIRELRKELNGKAEEAESRYRDGFQDGLTRKRERIGFEVSRTDTLIQDVLMIARKWHKDTYHKMVYSPEWKLFKDHMTEVIEENVSLKINLENMPESGWGAEHEAWRYRHIHPEV